VALWCGSLRISRLHLSLRLLHDDCGEALVVGFMAIPQGLAIIKHKIDIDILLAQAHTEREGGERTERGDERVEEVHRRERGDTRIIMHAHTYIA